LVNHDPPLIIQDFFDPLIDPLIIQNISQSKNLRKKPLEKTTGKNHWKKPREKTTGKNLRKNLRKKPEGKT
jgi:hypothetical protein